MIDGWKTWVTGFGALASVAVLATTTCDPFFLEKAEEEVSQEIVAGPLAEAGFIAWQDSGEDFEEQGPELRPQFEVDPPAGLGFWVQFVDGADRYVEGDVIVSAPGMWPALNENTMAGGYLELPANQVEMLSGQVVQFYELLVRGGDQGQDAAFWGVIRGPDQAVDAEQARPIRLGPAHPMELVVVDEEGEPIEGAFVRLSRDSVGLVHLNYTTEEDGRALFRRIPEGVYFLTLDADNYSRHTVRVEHSGRATAAMQVTLEEGRGLRLPQSWRGPPIDELIGDMGGSGAVDEAVAEGPGDEEESPEVAASTVALEVFAADERGAGVEDAWLEAWSNGRRVAQAMSQGNRPTLLNVPADASVSIVATHAGWGEGETTLSAPDDGDEVIIRMRGTLLSSSQASDRIRRLGSIEDLLGADVVNDRRRLLVDVRDSESPAARAGLERGDSLLFVRRDESGAHQAVVERRGEVKVVALPVTSR